MIIESVHPANSIKVWNNFKIDLLNIRRTHDNDGQLRAAGVKWIFNYIIKCLASRLHSQLTVHMCAFTSNLWCLLEPDLQTNCYTITATRRAFYLDALACVKWWLDPCRTASPKRSCLRVIRCAADATHSTIFGPNIEVNPAIDLRYGKHLTNAYQSHGDLRWIVIIIRRSVESKWL